MMSPNQVSIDQYFSLTSYYALSLFAPHFQTPTALVHNKELAYRFEVRSLFGATAA